MPTNEESPFAGWDMAEIIAFVNVHEGLESVKELLRLCKLSRKKLTELATLYRRLGLNDLASVVRARARRTKRTIADLSWRQRVALKMRDRRAGASAGTSTSSRC